MLAHNITNCAMCRSKFTPKLNRLYFESKVPLISIEISSTEPKTNESTNQQQQNQRENNNRRVKCLKLKKLKLNLMIKI